MLGEPASGVQLITYPDSLGGDLPRLRQALVEHFPGLFSGIHILPPYPSSGDRGFAPLTYLEIDPAFGSWRDIEALASKFEIVLDLMVNHISARSAYFQDFLANGRASEWSDLFLTADKVWSDGRPRDEDVERIFLRRPKPYSRFLAGSPAREEIVWTTFGREDPSEQVDMDWRSPRFADLISDVLRNFGRHGVRTVRLDAVGYLIKKLGTSCFFIEPDIYDILGWLARLAAENGISLLPEVHARPETQVSLSNHGFWTYDFILPYRVLEAILLGDPGRLREYLRARSPRQYTMLDCHDGVPVKPDLDGMYDPASARAVVRTCLERGGNLSLLFSPKHRDPDGFDVHQIRGTYYSLLGEDDDAYVAARAIQLFVPGIPQIYYVGLLAGRNDSAAVAATGEGREVNRHNYSLEDIGEEQQREVVQRLARLILLRNKEPAFAGSFFVEEAGSGAADELRMGWRNGDDACVLTVDWRTMKTTVERSDGLGEPALLRL